MDNLEARLRSLGQEVAGDLPTLRPRPSDLRRIRVRRHLLAGGGTSAMVLLMVTAVLAGTMWARKDPPRPFTLQTGDTQVISLDPARVHPGDSAQLLVRQAPGTWGLAWTLERREDDSSPWEKVGLLVAGPGDEWPSHFFLGTEADSVFIPDIGFTSSAEIPLQIPELEPGSYRLGQRFIRDQGSTPSEREEWHYAEFDVLQ